MSNTKDKKAIGTWLYPPVWISDITPDEFLKRFQPTDDKIQESGTVVLKDECDGLQFLVREDGFVAVGTNDRKIALEFYNMFVACAILQEISLYSVEEAEIVDFHMIDIENSQVGRDTIIGNHVIFLTPRSLLHSRHIATNKMLLANHLVLVRKNKIAEVIRILKSNFPKQKLRSLSRFVAQSYTYYEHAEYSASFILAWAVIENKIDEEWERFLSSKGIGGDRKDNLTSINWTVNHKLQAMNLSGTIDDPSFNILDKLRKKRNELVHDMIPLGRTETEPCLNFALNILRGQMGIGSS